MKDRQQILDEARRNIADAREIELAALATPIESASDRWRRKAEEDERETEHERRKNEVRAIERKVEAQLRASLTETFNAIVAAEHQYLVDQLLPQLIRELQDAIADDVSVEIERAYRLAFADMRADLAALRDAIRKALGTDAIDLPAIPLRGPKPN